MTTEQRSTALTLPDEAQFRHDIQAINRFQQICRSTLIEGADWGIIPGTTKPTLLKPGAEKIAKLLGLADQYEIVDRQEDWTKPFFRYLVRCKLVHIASQSIISEGLGECNSMESKYRYRWVGERDLPPGTDKIKLVAQERHSKTGGRWIVFRLENEDIYSQVNTILKMAKKRALVDAALSAGRLSNVFTQDIEDMREEVELPKPAKVEKVKPSPEPSLSPDAPGEVRESIITPSDVTVSPSVFSAPKSTAQSPIDFDLLKDSQKKAKFPDKTAISWLKSKANYQGLDFSGSLADIVARMNKEQADFLYKEITDRVSMA